MKETLRCCWFAARDSDKAAIARRGTGPGDPLADLFFSIAVSPVLRAIDQDIADSGRGLALPPTPHELQATVGVTDEQIVKGVTQSVYATMTPPNLCAVGCWRKV